MDLKSQVCSLELAKKLKKIGVDQSSLFYWVAEKDKLLERGVECFSIMYIHDFDNFEDEDSLENYEIFSAFTVAELGNMLQFRAIESNLDYSEADARAKMLIIDLIESKRVQLVTETNRCSNCSR
jgi:hypothetical protein